MKRSLDFRSPAAGAARPAFAPGQLRRLVFLGFSALASLGICFALSPWARRNPGATFVRAGLPPITDTPLLLTPADVEGRGGGRFVSVLAPGEVELADGPLLERVRDYGPIEREALFRLLRKPVPDPSEFNPGIAQEILAGRASVRPFPVEVEGRLWSLDFRIPVPPGAGMPPPSEAVEGTIGARGAFYKFVIPGIPEGARAGDSIVRLRGRFLKRVRVAVPTPEGMRPRPPLDCAYIVGGTMEIVPQRIPWGYGAPVLVMAGFILLVVWLRRRDEKASIAFEAIWEPKRKKRVLGEFQERYGKWRRKGPPAAPGGAPRPPPPGATGSSGP